MPMQPRQSSQQRHRGVSAFREAAHSELADDDPRAGNSKINSSTSKYGHNDAHITQLALKAGRGDRAALNEFVRATQMDVWRLVAHLGGTESADDLTQETYLRVMDALPRFAARSSARTWLLSLARRAWVDSVRHDMARPRKAAVEVEEATEQMSSGESWSELADARVLLEQLAAERREALILTQILGYSYAEAAEIAGCRVDTIRSRVARARKDLVEMVSTSAPTAQQSG